MAAARVKSPRRNREQLKAQIAAYLAEYLEREDRKVEWLADKSGVDRTTIWRIMSQKVLANEETLRSLARVVGVAPLVAAGYSVASSAQGEAGSDEEPFNPSTVQILDLADAELGFYLSQLGSMSPKTLQIIKAILREEYNELNAPDQAGNVQEWQRPTFARKVQPQ